jgi:hypothetical protein
MPWTMLDDGFPDHPKLVGLTMEQGYLWVLGINYCNRYLTDGNIPTGALAALHPTTPLARKRKAAQALVNAGLWDETPTGWAIHDFHDYQLSADEVKERRAKRAEAGRKGGRRSGQVRRSKAEANASSNGEANASPTVRSKREPHPIPSQPYVANTSSGLSPSDSPDDEPRRDPRVIHALEKLADEDLAAASTVRRIAKPDAYRAACLHERTTNDGPGLDTIAAQHADYSPDQIITTYLADRYLA